jgi:hypothetical protein
VEHNVKIDQIQQNPTVVKKLPVFPCFTRVTGDIFRVTGIVYQCIVVTRATVKGAGVVQGVRCF